MNTENKAVYFAYGTLLDLNEMKQCCPSAKSLGIMRLMDYKITFAHCKKNSDEGGCDLESFPGNIMYGILYEMPEKELRNLDNMAGHGDGLWTHMKINLLNDNDEIIPALTYIIPTPGDDFAPSSDYVKPILAGLKAMNIPEDYKTQVKTIIKKQMAN